MANALLGKNDEETCNKIAEFCNKNNISKEQFQDLINMFK
jgi:hypothetical protein